MIPFDFQSRTRVVFGPDTIDELGKLARELPATRALLVSDPGIVSAGHTERGTSALRSAGVETHFFEGVHENPTTEDVERGVSFAHECRPDLIVGLGGGSSMDCAKGINFIYTNGGRMQDYWGVNKARQPMLPMMAVPTTAGTGSETQSFALISDAETHAKMACGDTKAAFRIAVLDPKLTLTQPAQVTALSGLDALSHAVETYVTKRRNPISLAFSRESWRLLARNFPRVLSEPENLEARAGMQLGACLAGFAIENSMLGAAHALANPLTAQFNIVHGQAVGMMLPHVVRFNHAEVGGDYRELLAAMGKSNGARSPSRDADALAAYFRDLVSAAGLKIRLTELGIDRAAVPALAENAAQQWTAQFNPRRVDVESLRTLYEEAL